MSRGSKVYYLAIKPTTGDLTNSINSIISPLIAQEGDIAVPEYALAQGSITTSLASFTSASEAYQYKNSAWAAISNRETSWTDQNLIPNVSKIRLAHTSEMRSYINFLQRIYARRYGDKWYNTHDMSQAILTWISNNDIARMYIANYGSDLDFLTIEVGDNVTDMVKVVNRNGSANDAVTGIVDLGGDKCTAYVPFYFTTTTTANAIITSATISNLVVSLSAIFNCPITFSQDVTFKEKIIMDNSVDFDAEIQWGPNARIYSNSSSNQINILGSSKVVIEIPAINTATAKWGGTEYPILTTAHEGHTKGIDSDTLDGYHASDLIALIDAGSGGGGETTITEAQAGDVLVHRIAKAVFYIGISDGTMTQILSGKALEVHVPLPGTYRLSWEMSYAADFGFPGIGVGVRIYRNGVAISDMFSTYSTTPVVVTVDTSGWAAGDRLQLYNVGSLAFLGEFEIKMHALSPGFFTYYERGPWASQYGDGNG